MASPIKEIITVSVTKQMKPENNLSGQPLNHEFHLVHHQDGQISAWDWENFPVTDPELLLLLSTVAQQLLQYDERVRQQDTGFRHSGAAWEQLPDISRLLNSMEYIEMMMSALSPEKNEKPDKDNI